MITPADLTRLERALTDAQRRSHAAMDRRRALPAGSSPLHRRWPA